MPLPSKPLRHTMPNDDKEVQRLVEEALGVRPCLWQGRSQILALNDVITIAATNFVHINDLYIFCICI
jgi:hypothetical protein